MRTSLSRLWCASIVALTALVGFGCSGGDSLNPVTGKVLHKGQPLSGALVTLHPKGNNDPKVERPVGLTKADGTFTVMTGQKEGALAGEYVVTVVCSVIPPPPKGSKKTMSFGGEADTVDVLGGAYARAENSKINVAVKAGKNELETFDLK